MNINKDKIKKILIIRRNNIGDMICAIPLCRTLRKEFPNAHIIVLAEELNAGIIKGASFIDDVIVYKKGHGLSGNKYIGYYKFFKQNKHHFDLVVTAKAGFSSLLAYISLISRAKLRMGCIPEKWHPLQLCYNLPVKNCRQWNSINVVDGLLEYIKSIGVHHTVKDTSIEILPDSRELVTDYFKKNKILLDHNIVVFNISNNRPENTWSVEKFKETAYALSQRHKVVHIITSLLSDKEKAIQLQKEIGTGAFYFETPGIMDFAALIAEADLLICGEGGAMHIGVGVHTPTISLWGSRRPVKWMPCGENQIVLKKGEYVNTISSDDILDVIEKNSLLRK